MKGKALQPFVWLIALILVISLACAGPQAATKEPTAAPTKEVQPTATREPATKKPTATTNAPANVSGAVSSLEDVQKATIQIEVEGTFVDPQEGWNINVGKRGSGFIIDPSGIAVTNNHVVTGAALIRVWIGGDTSKTYSAKVLGVSECSDLAVIKIDGDNFSFLDWYSGDIKVGMEVYAAGFPLGEPQYALTNGIVSKTQADGATQWSSVDYVIQHSAKINPGNSGGPLVNKDGKVVGINYASIAEYEQNFAISRDEALARIKDLRAGKNVNSIGVNGLTVSGTINDIPIYGVWVRSVASGSPADKALLQPGDIIYQLEGEVLATDGTMKTYCEILKSRDATATMSMTVIRSSDLTLLEGQLNGRTLAVTGTFSGGSSSTEPTPSTGGTSSSGYIKVQDDTAVISMEVPSDWADVNGGSWQFSGSDIGVAITAAPNRDDFWNYYDAPGVFFGASKEFAKYGGYIQFLDYYVGPDGFNYLNNCSYNDSQRYDYNDGIYRGKFDYFYNCGGAGGYDAYVLSAVSIENAGSYIIIIAAQVPAGDGKNVDAIVDHIWKTFLVGRF